MKKILKLENIIYLVIAGLPLYLVKLNFFGMPSNVLEILQVAVLLWWVFDKNYKKPGAVEIYEKYGNYLIAIGLIFFGLLSSMTVNGNYRVALGIIKSWFLMPILFSFVVANIFNNEKSKNIWLAFYFSAALISLSALIYYFFGRLTYDSRLEAFFNSPNYLAMFLAPVIIVGFFYFEKNRKLFGISLLVIILAFYLTFSYAAWAALILSILIAGMLERKKDIIKSGFLWGGIILAVLFFSLQWDSGKLRAAYTLSARSSFSSRVMIWKTALKLAKENPLWGIGPGNFQSKYLEYQKFYPPYLEWAVPHPHNIFFTFFLYSGLAGLVGFVLLIIRWFRDILKKEKSKLRTVFLAVMLYTLLHGLVDTTYFKNDLAVIFWLGLMALNLKKAR